LFRTTPNKHAWLEIVLLAARLAAGFALTLLGWVTTVKAIALLNFKSDELPEPAANEAA